MFVRAMHVISPVFFGTKDMQSGLLHACGLTDTSFFLFYHSPDLFTMRQANTLKDEAALYTSYDKRRASGALSRITTKNGFSVRKMLSILSHNKPNDEIIQLTNSFGPYGLTLLHTPLEPLIDVVFVHGLRGGSVKTWRKLDDDQNFWPQAWLPHEPDLQNIRVHTFGYNSDWGERRGSSMNIHDFERTYWGT
jgi:hypothetical protein